MSARRLATIVALDVAGYSARTEADEARTTAEVALLRKVIEGIASKHGGRVFNTAGDGFMLEFGSSLAAVEAAFELAETCEPKVRVGVHLGDVVVQPNGDLLGHGVNVAARLMAQSQPGSALVSADVRRTIRGPLAEVLQSQGHLKLDKMSETIEAFAKGASPAVPARSPAATSAAKPSIAVLPFANISNDSEQAYFADGMTQEITTALSRIKALFVVANSSTQAVTRTPMSPQLAGRQLGVQYLLEGNVRKAANRVRIAVTLIDAGDGAQVWSERYDDTMDDIFALQDRVALSVAGVIEPTVRDAEARKVSRRPTSNTGCYDLYLKAWTMDSYEKDPTFEAIALLERAIELDPNYAQAMCLAAYYHAQIVVSAWSDDLQFHRNRVLELSRRALKLASDDADVLSMVTAAFLPIQEDVDGSIALIDRSLALNPGSAQSWMMSGWLRAAKGEADIAVEHLEKAMKLDPCSSDRAHYLVGIALARFDQGKFAEAVRLLKEAIPLQPAISFNFALLASCCGHLGERAAAQEALKRYGELSALDIHGRTALFHRPEHRALYRAGLDLAQGPRPSGN